MCVPGVIGSPDPHLDRAQGSENVRFHRFPARKSSPFWGAFGTPFRRMLFFRASGTLKKGGPGGPSKLDPFFCRFWDLPGGPQEGSRLHGSSIFTLQPDPKRAPKWEPKWSLLGSQTRTILNFDDVWAPEDGKWDAVGAQVWF